MKRLALAGVAGLLCALASPGRAEVAAPETTEVFVAPAEARPASSLALAHRFLLVGSASVTRGEQPQVAEVDYRLDHDAGTLTLATPLRPGETVRVSYAWVPLALPREFVGLRPAEPTPADSTRMRVAAAGDALSAEERLARVLDRDLAISGAKTLAIEAGTNRDANVEQSLRVSVTGRIGEDVELTALLSDQNIPLQPEGNTQRLEELDEVLIRLKGPRGSATLGDFVAEREGTAFGDFQRRLSGAQAEVRLGDGGARGIGASARGNFRTVEFQGEEGKQGPYRLAGSGVNPTGVIVAGSERVWVDGRALTRGETNDYVIDYSLGELEFTNRLLITEDSEIAVDFEVAEQEYRRNLYFGEGHYGTPESAVGFAVSLAAEVDDEEPLNVLLTEERRAFLEAAGDEPPLVPGAVCGVENGDYTEEGDHFVYAGRDSGTCDVTFTYVGPDAGSYVRDRDLDTGFVFFRFVGEGLGDYAPGLRLTAPRSATVADLGLRLGSGPGFGLEVDGALSREDRNTFSAVDDDDNDGAAGRAQLRWEKSGLGAPGGPVSVRTAASFRGEEAGFAPLGRTRDAYLGEVWNFTDTTRADETLGEVSALVEREGRWSLGGGTGVLDRVGRFRSRRWDGNFQWTGERVPQASLRVETVAREDEADTLGTVTSDLLREQADVTTRFGIFRPGVTFWKEDREAVRAGARLSGEDDVEVGGKLGIRAGRGVRADLRYARRTTDVVDGGAWLRESVGTTTEVRGEASPGRALRARVSWIRRRLDYEEGRPGRDRTTNLTRTDLSHENLGGLLRGDYVYETTSRVFADRFLGETAGEEPSLVLTASARLRLGGRVRARVRTEDAPPSGLRRWLGLFSLESVARVEEETTTDDRQRIYLLDFSRFQDDSTTVFGKMLLREEITLLPGAGPFSLTGRWEWIDTADNRTASTRVDLLTERRVLRARNALGPRWTLESQGTWEKDVRAGSLGGSTDFDLRRLELEEELVWQPHPSRRFSGRAAVTRERNEADGSAIRAVSGGFATSLSFRRSGRLQGDVSWTHPTSQEGVAFTDRFRTRDTDDLAWRTSLELRLSEAITASLTYTGRALEGVPPTHNARAQMRALF